MSSTFNRHVNYFRSDITGRERSGRLMSKPFPKSIPQHLEIYNIFQCDSPLENCYTWSIYIVKVFYV